TGELYTYTLYVLSDGALVRHLPQQFDSPIELRDLNTDGVSEELCKDRTMVEFANTKRCGPSEEIILQWDGNGWEFSSTLMKKKSLATEEFNKLVADVDSRIIHFDTA